ncbi:MAG: helix-turn-helix transcriptional regulator [Bacteroidota bacterium]
MSETLQSNLFEVILRQFDRRSQAVEKIMELLGVGKDAVYRRFRGETPLAPEELALLSRTFNISLDELIFDKADVVPFVYKSFSEPIKQFQDFLQEVFRYIQEIHVLPGSQFYYTTAEIPVFHYLHFPGLISFKLYVWARTIWNFGGMNERKFDFGIVSEKDLGLTNDILRMYNNVPSTELWHLNIVDNTLNQIEYHLKIGGFRKSEDALSLCDNLLELVDHMRLMAQHGCKFRIGEKPETQSNGRFDLYHNEMVSTNNTFLAITPIRRVIYTTYNTPDFLRCSDPKMCDYTESWFRKIIGKSVSISSHAEKSRSWYFNNLRRKVEHARQRMEIAIDDI